MENQMEQEKRKWIYSPFGKMLLGFACLLSFAVFIMSGLYLIYAVEEFGSEVIVEGNRNYYDTDYYENDLLSGEIWTAMIHINQIFAAQQNETTNTVSVIDVGQGEFNIYDLNDLYENYQDGIPTQLDLDSFPSSESEKIQGADDLNYKQYRKLLADDKYQDSYLLYNKDAFANLFIENGYVNTNYRFSGDFDESAFFVFDFQASDQNAKKELEKIKKCNKEGGKERYDLSGITYAVYDEVNDLYYSTEDDYFDPFETYSYKVSEVNAQLKEDDPQEKRYDNIVLGLLKCGNLNDDWISEPYAIYTSAVGSQKSLDKMFDLAKEGNFYFACQNGKILCSDKEFAKTLEQKNYKDRTEFENEVKNYLDEKQCNYYSFFLNQKGDIEYATDDKNLTSIEEIKGDLSPTLTDENSLFVYGFHKGKKVSGVGESCVEKRAKLYSSMSKNSILLVVVAILSFVLTVAIAIVQMVLTGRKAKNDKDIELILYDKIPGEIWQIISWALFFASITVSGTIYALFLENINGLHGKEMAVFVIGMEIIAIAVMLLTLSFCRRVKGKQFIRNTLIVRMIKKISLVDTNNKYLKRLQSIHGAWRMLVIYIFYAITSFVLVAFAFNYRTILPLLLWMLLLIGGAIGVLLHVWHTIQLSDGVAEIIKGDLDYKVRTDDFVGVYKEVTDNINHIGDGLKVAVETSLKDERMKTELITNVSHDIKTPLTSIINYIELLKKEEMGTEDAKHYVEVLDSKAQRLKQLTEDLVEAAKANSGNVELQMMPINWNELTNQALGEFEEKFKEKNLEVVTSCPKKPVMIQADGRCLYRVLENILQNICKYAMPNTRVYIDLVLQEECAVFTAKNISEASLNITADELMERFVRGDESRTTEGSGLGLAIAKDLTRLQEGQFEIELDGDLFKVMITFAILKGKN